MNAYRYDWVAYTREVLVCWEVQERPDGTSSRQMVRLLVLGEVDSNNVRGLPLRLIATADPADYPTWATSVGIPDLGREVPEPPQSLDVRAAWEAHRTPDVQIKVRIGPRDRREPIDDFYRRVAEAYRILAPRDGTPTTALANLAGVKRTTAARGVHEARKRGFLPPTTRGKVTR